MNSAIPNSVTSIGMGAFSGCTNLTSVTIPNSVTTFEAGAFANCSGLTSVTIPNSVTYIGEQSFYGSGLTSVTIPNSVSTIGYTAFRGCSSLTSVTIGSSVILLLDHAFAECSKLEAVYCLAEKVPNTYTNAFWKSYPEYMTLYVPAESLNAYKTTAPWSQFGTILPLPDEMGIEYIVKYKVEETDRYMLDGIKGSGARKGLNIIRMSDGTVKKVVVK